MGSLHLPAAPPALDLGCSPLMAPIQPVEAAAHAGPVMQQDQEAVPTSAHCALNGASPALVVRLVLVQQLPTAAAPPRPAVQVQVQLQVAPVEEAHSVPSTHQMQCTCRRCCRSPSPSLSTAPAQALSPPESWAELSSALARLALL